MPFHVILGKVGHVTICNVPKLNLKIFCIEIQDWVGFSEPRHPSIEIPSGGTTVQISLALY